MIVWKRWIGRGRTRKWMAGRWKGREVEEGVEGLTAPGSLEYLNILKTKLCPREADNKTSMQGDREAERKVRAGRERKGQTEGRQEGGRQGGGREEGKETEGKRSKEV